MDYTNMVGNPNKQINPEDKAKTKKVVKTEVKEAPEKEKGVIGKIIGLFIVEDLDSIKTFVKDEVIIPNVKRLVLSTFSDTFDFATGGVARSKLNKLKGDVLSYDKMYGDRMARLRTNSTDVKSYFFETKEDADDVLEELLACIETYNKVTVGDYYSAVGRTSDSESTDWNYGWRYLGSAQIKHLPNGMWTLILPKPVVLNVR